MKNKTFAIGMVISLSLSANICMLAKGINMQNKLDETYQIIKQNEHSIDSLKSDIYNEQKKNSELSKEIERLNDSLKIEQNKNKELKKWKKIAVSATAYSLIGDELGNDGTPETSTGVLPQVHRTVAVDPTVIPYGSEIYIPSYDEDNIYIAEDCGGWIKGNEIDIYMANGDICDEWGRQNIDIFVKEPNSK